MANTLRELSIANLKRAVSIKEQIEKLEAELNGLLGSSAGSERATSGGGSTGGRRKMSAEARARISAAAKARWAKVKGQSTPTAKPAKAKRTMSAEARKRISEAAKARWAKAKAGKK
jgi:hypothetical protein